mmetsp:Transcript_32293/g.23849  ORF Transcript_32293/g.23849 Transcript_32293/m.23849 type:complete len:107 (+) Transcript_32293:560-880(+)
MGVFGSSVDLTLSPVDALLPSANVVLISQQALRIKASPIMAAKLLVQGVSSASIIDSSGFESTVSNSCNEDESDYSNLFQCVPFGAQYSTLTQDQYIDNFNAQFGT